MHHTQGLFLPFWPALCLKSLGEVAGDKELLRGFGLKGPEGFYSASDQLQDLKSSLSPYLSLNFLI